MATNASGAASSISGGGAPDRPPHLVHVFPSFEYGGVPIRISTIINHLGDRYRHTILSLDGNTACSSRLDRSIEVELVEPAIDKTRPISSFLVIRRILRALGPDLLLTYNWGSIEWALVNGLLGFPHIHLESGFSTQEADRQLRRRVWARRLALARGRCLIVPSFTLVNLAQEVWRIAPAKIRHIPNGVDCERFAAAPDPSAAPGFTPKPGELVVGTVAPLRPEKNLHRLLRVFAAVAGKSAARLLIAGDGNQRPALEAAVRSLGLTDRVVFTGHVEAPEKVYGLMDVFAISSDTEQMPNTLIQAMAASRPVAGVDVGDVKANLAPANWPLIVPKTDEAAFAAALQRLLDEPDLRRRLGAANRDHVRENYSQGTMFDAYGVLFDHVLSRSGR